MESREPESWWTGGPRRLVEVCEMKVGECLQTLPKARRAVSRGGQRTRAALRQNRCCRPFSQHTCRAPFPDVGLYGPSDTKNIRLGSIAARHSEFPGRFGLSLAFVARNPSEPQKCELWHGCPWRNRCNSLVSCCDGVGSDRIGVVWPLRSSGLALGGGLRNYDGQGRQEGPGRDVGRGQARPRVKHPLTARIGGSRPTLADNPAGIRVVAGARLSVRPLSTHIHEQPAEASRHPMVPRFCNSAANMARQRSGHFPAA